jgi:hypothetical protein
MVRVCLPVVALLGAASALPLSQRAGTESLPADAKFQLMALRSGSEIHFAPFSAAKNSVFLDLPSQNATCADGPEDRATFFLRDGGLYLYGDPATKQQLYADRSGMGTFAPFISPSPCFRSLSCLTRQALIMFSHIIGQGKFGYTTGTEPPPRNAEQTGWVLDEANNLSLNGTGLIACPNSIDGAWSVWVYAGIDQPAGNSDCVGFSARAVQIDEPNSCLYTS